MTIFERVVLGLMIILLLTGYYYTLEYITNKYNRHISQLISWTVTFILALVNFFLNFNKPTMIVWLIMMVICIIFFIINLTNKD